MLIKNLAGTENLLLFLPLQLIPAISTDYSLLCIIPTDLLYLG